LVGLVVRRLISFFLVLLLVLTVLFLFFRVGLGPDAYLPKGGSPGYIEDIREELHLNESIVVQYFYFLGDMLTGGGSFELHSYATRTQVGDAIRLSFPPTLMLFGLSAILSLTLGFAYQRLILRLKSWTARAFGSAIAFILWALPFVLVFMFLIAQIVFRFNLWPISGTLPLDYNQMNAAEKTLEQLKIHALPIIALLIVSLGGFALMMLHGAATNRPREAPGQESQFVARRPIFQTIVAVVPSLKLNLAWIMSCVIIAEVMYSLGGLGRYSIESIFRMDIPLMEASLFCMVVIVLIAGLCLDLTSSILSTLSSRRTTATTPTISPNPSAEATAPIKVGSLPDRMLAESKWFIGAYLKSTQGLIGLVLFAAVAVLAIIGPFVASSPGPGWPGDLDPVSEFLRGSRDPFVYALAITILALALGVIVGTLSVAIGRYNYPVVLLAECFIAFPILVMILAMLMNAMRPDDRTWVVVGSTVLVMWAPVALAVMKARKDELGGLVAGQPPSSGMARFRRTVTGSLRQTLPDAISALKYGVVIGMLSILLFEYLFGGGWSGMIDYTLQRGYWEEISLWWILPTIGYVLLLSSFYLVLQAIADLLRTRLGQPTYPPVYRL